MKHIIILGILMLNQALGEDESTFKATITNPDGSKVEFCGTGDEGCHAAAKAAKEYVGKKRKKGGEKTPTGMNSFSIECDAVPLDLHQDAHSLPTRRASDLRALNFALNAVKTDCQASLFDKNIKADGTITLDFYQPVRGVADLKAPAPSVGACLGNEFQSIL